MKSNVIAICTTAAVAVVITIVILVINKANRAKQDVVTAAKVEVHTATAAENKALELSCDKGTMKIESVSYGNGTKLIPGANERVAVSCAGKSTCSFPNTNAAWGSDPAPNLAKTANVGWTCQW